ncbi:FtsZ/tubulin family protein [Paenibacillus macquariensis]|uniref:Tubulin/FtsZ family, GTPase domain n=1 Tax=Paenibacillus macquariensis TaxID=948756 RepID=A0ABY1KEM5_9BACL|nr:hypothetical protein [Paenibacillus macquariensis]OAB28468.1 hypothetical protein PMSM_24395 [Paenibacillus macquariensis subsp. macquariensis]SIR71898.1 Tubulin/FtsZ family, GTPase domain [Paenibacillus macquariensis]
MQQNIDQVWPLEGFVQQKNADSGLKMGFVGLGQGGSKITDAFAGIKRINGEQVYPCIIVNSNKGDMNDLKNIPARFRLPLIGYETGVGKDPDIGRKAFEENGSTIFEVIGEEMKDCNIIFVVNSMGGGTGTGAVNILVDAIADFLHVPVAVITTLPRPNQVESLNAYNAMVELAPKLNEIRTNEEDDNGYRVLQSLVILDNEKIVKEHSEAPEVKNLTWDLYSNYKVASILHEWSVLTSLESAFTLDAADLLNHIILAGGVITFAKKKINLEEVTNNEDLINEIISTYKGRNVLANGFDYEKDMRSLALVVVLPRDRKDRINQDTLEVIRTRMKVELPNVDVYLGSVTYGSKTNAIVYTMANMGGLPERARNLRTEAETLKKLSEEREKAASGFDMGGKIEKKQILNTRARLTSGNPFDQVAATSENDSQLSSNRNRVIKNNPFPKR